MVMSDKKENKTNLDYMDELNDFDQEYDETIEEVEYADYDSEIEDMDIAEFDKTASKLNDNFNWYPMLAFASSWFIRIGIAIGIVLFIFLVITLKIKTLLLYILGLIVAFFFGYFFMYCLDIILSK